MKVSRSFSRTLQEKQYEPIKFYCSFEQECEEGEVEKVSAKLEKMCRDEVEKALKTYEGEHIKVEIQDVDYS